MSSALASSRDRGNLLLPLFCLGAAVANQGLFRLGAMSSAWTAIFLLTIAALYVLAPQFDALPINREPLRLQNLAIGALVLAPLIASFVIGWNREFPFSGDTYFHVGQSYRIAFWWLSPVASAVVKVPTLDDVHHLVSRPLALLTSRLVMLAAVTTVSVLLYRWRRNAALAFATLAFFVWGLSEATIFLRYPDARYLLDLPFLGPAYAVNDLELAGRLSNVTGAIAWLFVLRPWLVGRWPDLRILPLALLLLWQKDLIYYFDSVYLEPWGVIFSLLAAEVLLDKGRDGAPTACLLIGAAATVKEPFILALPFVWLAGEPWRQSWRGVIRLTAAAVAAGMPFMLYVAARKSIDLADIGNNRTVEISVSASGLQHYAGEFARNIVTVFPGTGGLLALAALAASIVLVLRSQRRLVLACLLGAACLIAALFVVDVVSQRWPGYFRFVMYSLPFLVGGPMYVSQRLQARWALALAGLVLLLQAPSAYSALALAAGAPSDRNFVEWFDSPLVFPLKSLTADARRAGVLTRGAPVMANLVDGTLRPLPGSSIAYGDLGKMYCGCEAEHPNVMALFVRFTNMSRGLATEKQPADSRYGVWQATDAQRQACLATLKQSCGHVFTRVEGGELVGALGTKN